MDTFEYLSSCPINPKDARAFGWKVAPYLFFLKRCESISRMEQDVPDTKEISFSVNREVIQSRTSLTFKEQREIEQLLILVKVIDLEEISTTEFEVEINWKFYRTIVGDPERFKNLLAS